jgi:hypothetical protein
VARVYISSTLSDLREHRVAVYDALRASGHDVVAMDDYVATDQRPLDRVMADVASSDVYVGIIAWRYGHVPKDHNPEARSITELEYREARRLGVPRLMFLLDEHVPWSFSSVETGPRGARLEAFRAEVALYEAPAYFSTPEDLASQVEATVRALEASPAGAAPSVGGEQGLSLLLAYASSDRRLVSELELHLAGLIREGLVSKVREFPVDSFSDGPPLEPIRRADVVLLMISAELQSSGLLDSAEFHWLLERQSAGQPLLVPVALRPISWRSIASSLRHIPPLPAPDRAVTQSRNHEAAFVEVVDGVRLACVGIRSRRRRRPPEAESPDRARRPVRTYRLVEVFKESGVPSVTFVEPDDFYQLKLALEQPGRGVVIEGPSGVGKTTALHTAIGQLEREFANGGFEVLSARDGAAVARIAKLRSWHRGPVAIDDFHRLTPDLQRELVDYLKLLADTEPVDRKLVVVGIPGTKQRLAQLAFDVATRIDVISLGTVSDDKMEEMVGKGEAALNIELLGKAEIVRTAAGSLNIAQVLCRHVVALAGIKETQTSTTPVRGDLRRATRKALDMMSLKFGGLIRSFASLDEPSERLCIELLMELAVAEDGTLSLPELRQRRPDLRAGIDRLVDRRLVGALGRRHPGHDQHLLYDPAAASLVIDDPQLTFYLRQLNYEQLAVSVGKRPLAKRTQVFVSYSRRDAQWLKLLRVHLKPLERDGLIDLWDDTRIAAGSVWRDELEAVLASAKVAVLMISADFLASDFIMDNELPPLLDAAQRDGCLVLPLLVRPSLFAQTPQLSRFQTVNPGAVPLASLTVDQRETILVELAKRIADQVKP